MKSPNNSQNQTCVCVCVCVKYYEYIKVRGSLSLFSPEERSNGAARGSEGI